LYVIVIAWLYVALMMAAAEASHANGSLVGALFTFILYGLFPVALVIYVLKTPDRKKARLAKEAQEAQEAQTAALKAGDSKDETP
jgi:mannose/fructose/N-acetylgalactosamine-specific phosphotransferase system component IID